MPCSHSSWTGLYPALFSDSISLEGSSSGCTVSCCTTSKQPCSAARTRAIEPSTSIILGSAPLSIEEPYRFATAPRCRFVEGCRPVMCAQIHFGLVVKQQLHAFWVVLGKPPQN